MYSGLSGLDANGTALSVIGNNIANVNTVGYKSSDVAFEDVLGAAIGGEQLGQGVTVGSITSAFTQGAFESTNSSTDLALSGNGFFVVSDGTTQYYTRAGQFTFDANGNLINPQQMSVQGWLANPDGSIDTSAAPTNLSVGNTVSSPSATTSFNLGMNLNGQAVDGETFSNSIDVYDSKGGKETLTVTFTYDQANNQWNWTATSSDPAATVTGSGVLQFDANGNLISPTTDPTIAITGLSDGANSLSMSWDLVDSSGASNGSVTSFASASVVNTQTQDGFGAGSLQGVTVDEHGVITGSFSNGQARALGQVVIADFTSPWGLTSLGQGIYGASRASGDAAIGAAGSGGRGDISSGALEQSNVDLSKEFVKMITAQRGFQASSRVITTTDQILMDVINIKQ